MKTRTEQTKTFYLLNKDNFIKKKKHTGSILFQRKIRKILKIKSLQENLSFD
jgi:hypothetical protein